MLEFRPVVLQCIVVVYEGHESVKEEACIKRTGTCFRMELNAECREFCVCDSFAGSVVGIDEAQLGSLWKGLLLYSISVVLA